MVLLTIVTRAYSRAQITKSLITSSATASGGASATSVFL
jgi:hypothetical protein